MVGATGFEPATSSSQNWHSTKLSYAPTGPKSYVYLREKQDATSWSSRWRMTLIFNKNAGLSG